MKLLANLNIRERITIQFMFLVGVLFLMFSFSIFYFAKLYLENRFYKRLQDRALIAATLYFDFNAGQKALLKTIDKDNKESLQEELVSIYDVNRKLIMVSTNPSDEKLHKRFISELTNIANINERKIGLYQIAGVSLNDKVGRYLVSVSAKDTQGENALSDLKNILSILGMVSLMCIAYLGWYFANKAFMPINELRHQLNSVFPKNLSKRIVYEKEYDEIGQLSVTINNMLQRAENASLSQKLFVANISHELKNPLTKIYTQIELLELKYRQDAGLLKEIESLKKDAKSLNMLSENILNLANIYASESELPMLDARIDEVLLEAVADFKRWNQHAHVEIEWKKLPEKEEDLYYKINRDSMKVVFNNLIDNGCKFALKNTIKVTIEAKNDMMEINFINDGASINDEDKQRIFEPFYRSDATAKGKKGHGIGLAVVKQICQMHAVNISVGQQNDMTEFSLEFKKAILS